MSWKSAILKRIAGKPASARHAPTDLDRLRSSEVRRKEKEIERQVKMIEFKKQELELKRLEKEIKLADEELDDDTEDLEDDYDDSDRGNSSNLDKLAEKALLRIMDVNQGAPSSEASVQSAQKIDLSDKEVSDYLNQLPDEQYSFLKALESENIKKLIIQQAPFLSDASIEKMALLLKSEE